MKLTSWKEDKLKSSQSILMMSQESVLLKTGQSLSLPGVLTEQGLKAKGPGKGLKEGLELNLIL